VNENKESAKIKIKTQFSHSLFSQRSGVAKKTGLQSKSMWLKPGCFYFRQSVAEADENN